MKKKWTDENAPESGEIKRTENPKLFREAERFMESLLSEEAEIETAEVIKFDELKDDFTAAEIDCLITLGMLKDE